MKTNRSNILPNKKPGGLSPILSLKDNRYKAYLSILMLMVSLLILTVSIADASEKPDTGKFQYMGSWIFKNDEKSPPPPGQIKLLTFSLDLKQEGDKITGKYDYITFNATRIREGKIEGIVKDNIVKIKFENPEYKWEKGEAIIKPGKGGIEWILKKSPEGEHFIPGKALLKRVKIGK